MTFRQKYKREHKAWSHMRQRCVNPKDSRYQDYGGRGIAVCERWDSFENFMDDLGPRPEGLSIDRIDNDGDYEPGNVRWATDEQQNNNQRLRKDNTSGVSGVNWNKKERRWITRFQGRHLGINSDFFESICMRKSAEVKFFNR